MHCPKMLCSVPPPFLSASWTFRRRVVSDPLRCRYWETEVSSGDQLQHLIDNPNLLGDQRQYGFSLPKLSEPGRETVARGTSSDGTSPAAMSETLAPSTVDPVFTFGHVSAVVRSVHCNVLCSTECPSECTNPASVSPFVTCALACPFVCFCRAVGQRYRSPQQEEAM